MIAETLRNTTAIKFDNRPSDFYRTLKQRTERYFQERNLSKKANCFAILKTTVFFLCTVLSYGLILTDRFAGWPLFGLYLIWGLSSAFFVFSIAHDAAHHAFAKSGKLNDFLSYSWNLMGISSYVWKLKHNIAHHTYTNVQGTDQDIDQGALFVLKPNTPVKPHHRFQHLYSPLVYAFYSFYLIYVKDFQLYATHRFGNKVITSHPKRELIILLITKLFYFTYSFLIPLIILSVDGWKIILMYLFMHFAIGITMAFILGPVHITGQANYVNPDAKGRIHNCWARHQIECTIDFAAQNAIVGWFSGGLNTHISHHIFPTICHVHYRPLTKIIKQTAEEYGIKYTNMTLIGAIAAHLNFLKQLGRKDKSIVVG